MTQWLTKNCCLNSGHLASLGAYRSGFKLILLIDFQAYFTNRLQYVAINGAASGVLPVTSGVPQGSILGPILFLVFVNDLPATVTSSLVLMFADDADCAHSIFKLSDSLSLQEDLNNIVLWSTTWNLLFNVQLLDFSLNVLPFFTTTILTVNLLHHPL